MKLILPTLILLFSQLTFATETPPINEVQKAIYMLFKSSPDLNGVGISGCGEQDEDCISVGFKTEEALMAFKQLFPSGTRVMGYLIDPVLRPVGEPRPRMSGGGN